VLRTITGFHADEVGDWVAELSCLHAQHVRHDPPFRLRPWVGSEAGRAGHVGTELDCPLCDRAELPAGLELARTAGPFDASTLPAGLRRHHTVATGTWGVLRVIEGTVRFSMRVEPPLDVVLRPGAAQPIPPGVAHLVELDEGTIAVDFLRRPPPPAGS